MRKFLPHRADQVLREALGQGLVQHLLFVCLKLAQGVQLPLALRVLDQGNFEQLAHVTELVQGDLLVVLAAGSLTKTLSKSILIKIFFIVVILLFQSAL